MNKIINDSDRHHHINVHNMVLSVEVVRKAMKDAASCYNGRTVAGRAYWAANRELNTLHEKLSVLADIIINGDPNKDVGCSHSCDETPTNG